MEVGDNISRMSPPFIYRLPQSIEMKHFSRSSPSIVCFLFSDNPIYEAPLIVFTSVGAAIK